MRPQHVILLGDSNSPRLTSEEVEALFAWTLETHDHNASRPQPAIFWHRDDDRSYWKFVN